MNQTAAPPTSLGLNPARQTFVLLGDFHDVALRDVGLLLAALALARLPTASSADGQVGARR